MILYHFTSLMALGMTGAGELDVHRQWPDGILPQAANDEAGALVCPDPVVWLTADPNPGGDGQGFVIRLAVRINSFDRHLVEHRRYMNRRFGKRSVDAAPDDYKKVLALATPWRLYFGTITPEKIVEVTGCTRPWWRCDHS